MLRRRAVAMVAFSGAVTPAGNGRRWRPRGQRGVSPVGYVPDTMRFLRQISVAALLPLLGCADTAWEHRCSETPSAGPAQPCDDDGATITCAHFESRYRDAGLNRVVLWQLPGGAPPAQGWPAVLVFQGTGHSAVNSFEARVDDAWGGWWQAQLSRSLLEAGYAVIAPGTRLDATWWDTNILPWSITWQRSRDHRLMLGLFAGIEAGELGPLDLDALYATGISSGGYMTSRMAVAYPGRFQALAIQSASYASCGGALCSIPALPADHPPTLFLHGEQDEVVPVDTMLAYHQALVDQGTPAETALDPDAHHGWLPVAPEEITGWFEGH